MPDQNPTVDEAKKALTTELTRTRRGASGLINKFPNMSEDAKAAIDKAEAFFVELEAEKISAGDRYVLSDEDRLDLLEALGDGAIDPNRVLTHAELLHGHWGACREYGEGSNQYRHAIDALKYAYLDAMDVADPTAEFGTDEHREQIRAINQAEEGAESGAKAFAKLVHQIAYETIHPPQRGTELIG